MEPGGTMRREYYMTDAEHQKRLKKLKEITGRRIRLVRKLILKKYPSAQVTIEHYGPEDEKI